MNVPDKIYAVINSKGWLTTAVDEEAARRHHLASEGSTLARITSGNLNSRNSNSECQAAISFASS